MAFEFKPFEEMTPEDYAAIGLRSGLEIHQQVLTERKLFCRCPAGRYSDAYDTEILRHMRPTLSELGEYDGTALMEFKTRKEIIYRIHSHTVCTYEMDDTPPFMMDDQALDIAIEVALLLKLNMVGELHIARKQYLDGSIPTGFQRTTILGVDGWIPYKDRKIGIVQLGLEEDACREVSDVGHRRVYLTDRLGMPLIETVTYPEMRTPQEVAEVAQILRRLVRATGKMRQGYGAGREDVNVSVTGGTRIEIKGVPRIPRIPLLVYNEAMRQCALLRIRDELKARGLTPENFETSVHDVTRPLARTRYTPIQRALERGEQIRCVLLKGFGGVLAERTQTDTTFAKEFSDRVRVIACLTRLPNIAHSDTASEALSATDWKLVRQRVKTRPEDALVLVWGDKRDVECACNEIVIRAQEALEGIPEETRQALKDGTNGFERILPGADRMYPDTDLPPIALDRDRIEGIRKRLPVTPWDRETRLSPMGLSPDVLDRLTWSPRADLFERIVGELDLEPILVGEVLVRFMKSLAREGFASGSIPDAQLFALFAAFKDGKVAREGLRKVLKRLAAGDPVDEESASAPAPETTGDEAVTSALDALGLIPLNDDEVDRRIREAVEWAGTRTFPDTERKHRFLMGVLMKDALGRTDGRRLAERLTRALASA